MVRSFDIPYGRQTIDDDDIAAVVAALRSPRLTQGSFVERFEAALSLYLGAPHVSVCSSGTAALHLVYTALGVGAGDEIITTPVTFSATASAVHALGGTVRFADVNPYTGTLSPQSVEALIGPRTQGIVAVHLGGLPAELTALSRICDRHGLWLVEDASHAIGARYRGAPIGSATYSDAAVFSFHPVKNMTTGEGGAVSVRSPELKRRIDQLRHHGIVRDPDALLQPSPGRWYYEVQRLGFNYRLSDLQCALGLSQLDKLPGWIARRSAIAARYREATAGAVAFQPVPSYAESAYHLMIALIDFCGLGTTRAAVMETLAQRGIGSQVHYIPLPHHPYYRGRYGEQPDPPGVAAYYERALSIPMYPAMTDEQVDCVAATLLDVLVPRKNCSIGDIP